MTLFALKFNYLKVFGLLFLGLISGVSAGAASTNPIEFSVLENGMEVIYVENHSNPVAASVVIVKTGVRNETPAINGASHYLEHLLFNGTKRRTQKQLYDEMDFIGGYNNAHTDWDYTDFMVLAPKDQFETALDIQADMLFNSTLLPEKFKKERKIVLEEIAKDRTQPSYTAEEFFNYVYFKGTMYAYPVLGSYESLANTTRDEVFAYYKAHYVPNNMVAVIIGDFETSKMKKIVEKYFGPYPPGDVPPAKPIRVQPVRSKDIFITHGSTRHSLLSMAIPAPKYSDADYYAFEILNSILNEKLSQKFQETNPPKVFQVYSDYVVHPDVSLLKIDATLAPGTSAKEFVGETENVFRQLREQPISPLKLRHMINSIRAENTYLFERPHYFGMMKATYLYLGGYDFLKSYHAAIQKVTPQAIQRVAQTYLANVQPVVTVTKPEPQTKEAQGNTSLTAYKKDVLANGLTVIVKQSTGSQVTGFHVLAKNRLLMEPVGKNGITEVLHYMLLKGTRHFTEEALQDTLEAMGTRLKVHDNPYIPYDNYYLSRFYSYIRMESLEDFEIPSFKVLAELIEKPKFTKKALESVKAELANQASRQGRSAHSLAVKLFAKRIFADSLLVRPVLGRPNEINSITLKDLKNYYKVYFSPRNLILTIVTNRPVDKMMAIVKKNFGSWTTGKQVPMVSARLNRLTQSVRIEKNPGKGQSYILVGKPLNQFDPADYPALMVTNAILSSRIAFHLREQKGWAYSIGSSVVADKLPYFAASMGTRPQNAIEAEKALLKEIREFPGQKLTDKEVQKSIHMLIGRYLMRQLPRENQAYFLGLSQFAFGDYRIWTHLFERMKQVNKADVKRMAKKYFGDNRFVTIMVK